MTNKNQLTKKVNEIYNWIGHQLKDNPALAGQCDACGRCCDFAQFDHRLFVTTPEILYLAANLGPQNIKKMKNSRCPYNIDSKCTIHNHRFAGCRIFCCKADKNFQSRLSESTLEKFKALCVEFKIPYNYTDLPTALNNFDTNMKPDPIP